MKCSHCQVPKAKQSWTLQICADKRKKRVKYLCDKCDTKLNALVLKFFHDPQAKQKMKEYNES